MRSSARCWPSWGCSQVVRATLRSPNGKYLVTAGIFNLDDVAGAEWAHEKIKPLVDNQKGRFQGMVAGRGTECRSRSPPPTSAGTCRGHYLVYCIIAKADGKEMAGTTDAFAKQILFDLIELHLRQLHSGEAGDSEGTRRDLGAGQRRLTSGPQAPGERRAQHILPGSAG